MLLSWSSIVSSSISFPVRQLEHNYSDYIKQEQRLCAELWVLWKDRITTHHGVFQWIRHRLRTKANAGYLLMFTVVQHARSSNCFVRSLKKTPNMINLFRPVYDAVYQPWILYNSTNYLWPSCMISVTISDISDDDNSSAKKQNWKSANN